MPPLPKPEHKSLSRTPVPSHPHTPVAVLPAESRRSQAAPGGNHEAVREEILSNSWPLALFKLPSLLLSHSWAELSCARTGWVLTFVEAGGPAPTSSTL